MIHVKFAIFTTSVRPKRSICLWWIFTRGAFRARNAIKKVHDATKTGCFFSSRAPLSQLGHSERERSLGLRATDHSQLHPLHEMHSLIHTHTGPSRRTLHQRAREVSPPTGRTHFRNWMFESGRPTFNYVWSLFSKTHSSKKRTS